MDVEAERRLGIELFNSTWDLIELADRTPEQDDAMLHMAHASRHHWGASGADAAHLGRGEWQCSRVYAVLRRAEPAMHHANRYLWLCTDNGIGDWDLAFAHEALARAYAVAGDTDRARAHTERALAVDIADDGDRALLLEDLASIPDQKPFW